MFCNLNEHLKLGINIHPAGEWLLDNFYIIEETVKQIQKELPLKKYINFVGKEVEVLALDGKKYRGILKSVAGRDFVVTIKEKIKKL